MSVSDCLQIKLEIELVYGQNGYFYCLVARRLSVSMKICAQRKAGRRKRARQEALPLFFLHPMVHCASSTVRRFFALASMPKTKRLRRK